MKSTKWITALCCGASVISSLVLGSGSHAAEKAESVKEYIVQAENDSILEKVTRSFEDEIVADQQEGSLLEDNHILLMDLTVEQAHDLDQERDVSVERNITLRGEGMEGPDRKDVECLAKVQWNKTAVGADNVKKSAGKKNVNVAILDSGVDILSDVSFGNQISLIPEENTDDRTGHGTMISNLIASNRNGFCETGIIPGNTSVSLHNVRILDEENQTPLSRVIEGIQWCIDNQMDVVNMSFGTETNSEILHDAIKKAEEAGIVMVASVGNGGERGDGIIEYPAGYNEVIGVGSVNEKMERSAFSNTGASVELVAPGENIPITSYWGLQGSGSGTSYAAAHVTAVAALLWSENLDRNAQEIRNLMDKNAIALGDRNEYGHGLVNYEYASRHGELADAGEGTELSEENEGIREKEEGVSNGMQHIGDAVQEYDIPVSLKASWNSEGHTNLISSLADGLMNTANINAIKAAATYVDTSNTLNEYDVLHARKDTNYISAAKRLYHAALDWNGGSDYGVLYEEAERYTSADESEGLIYKNVQELKIAMRKAVYYDFRDTSKTGITANRGRLQLLGLAIHVAGDAYAHKTMCDSSQEGIDEINNIYTAINMLSNNIIKESLHSGNMKTIIDAVKSENGLTTSDMGSATYFKQDKDHKWVCNKYYTDSINYMGKRYSVATKVATSYLLKYYSSGKYFSPLIFCPYEIKAGSDFRNNYKYKLRHFRAYLTDAGFSPLSFTNGKNSYSVSDIYALSFDK